MKGTQFLAAKSLKWCERRFARCGASSGSITHGTFFSFSVSWIAIASYFSSIVLAKVEVFLCWIIMVDSLFHGERFLHIRVAIPFVLPHAHWASSSSCERVEPSSQRQIFKGFVSGSFSDGLLLCDNLLFQHAQWLHGRWLKSFFGGVLLLSQ